MDRRAVQTLEHAYWSSAGWRDPPATPPEDELAHAVDAGVMFDGTDDAAHDEVVDAVLAARDALDEDEVRGAFLASLTSHRLDLRSALGSFAVARHLERHAHDPDSSGLCRTCGLRAEQRDIDRNVMSFERFKWGGVRHDDLVYVAFDLERFAAADHPEATSDDRALLGELLDELEAAPPKTTAAKAAAGLLRALKGNKAERAVLIDILGLCSVLQTSEHRGRGEVFPPRDRPLVSVAGMRSVAVCKLTAPASTDAEGLGQKLLREVLPEVAGQDGDATVLACGLFRRRERDEEMSVHLCRVLGDGAVDARLEGVGDALAAAGTEPGDVRRLDEAACVPDEGTLDAAEQGSRSLLVCRVRLEHDRDREAFERLLVDILRADVERGATRTNMFDAFRVLRDEAPSRPTDWRYVLEARGSFFSPNLFPGTVERLEAEGARVVEGTEYGHVGNA